MKGVYFAQSLNSHLLNSRLSSQNKSLSKCLHDWITTSRTWISKHNSSSLICVIRCPNLKKIFIRNILKTVANNCVINNGESPDFLNFLRNCLTIFFNILDIGSASPQSYPFLFTWQLSCFLKKLLFSRTSWHSQSIQHKIVKFCG